MKMKHILWTGLASMVILSGLFSCKDSDVDGKSAPQILYHSSELVVDLNQPASPAVIAVINSETGLKSVATYLVKENDVVEQLDQTETRFYNPHTFSIKKNPLYTEDMTAIRIVAVDRAGQQLVSDLPVRIIPLTELPDVWFTDADGNVITSYTHYQGDPMPNIRIHAQGPEDINTLSPFQVLQSSVQLIVDPVDIQSGNTSIDIGLKDLDDGYVFGSGIMALRVKITAGALNRVREATLSIRIMKAITLTIDQNEQVFNGLAENSGFGFSGSVEYLVPFGQVTYKLLDRKRQEKVGEQILVTTADGEGKVTFTESNINADMDLGYILVKATSHDGARADEYEIPIHVGYKYWHLLASSGGAAANNAINQTGMILNSTDGVMYKICEAMDNCEKAEVGFAAFGDVRLTNLYYFGSNKFATNDDCTLYTPSATPKWDIVNSYRVFDADNTTPATFMEVTADELAAETGTTGVSNYGSSVITDVYAVQQFHVAFYEKVVDGQTKKVIVYPYRFESWAPGGGSSYQYCLSTFWVHVKTEI